MAEDENRFEKENRAFYNRVLAAYMAIAKRAPERVVPVDAADPIPTVQKRIIRIVEERLLPTTPQTKLKV
jgi:dTMP kinase